MSTSATQRIDPYKNFKFRLWFEGRHVYGGDQLLGFTPFPATAQHRAGGDPSTSHKSPGRNKYESITLERGVTHDPAFLSWANSSGFSGATGASSADCRKNIFLECYDGAGNLLNSYQLLRCWVLRYRSLPSLGGDANAIAIEHLHLAFEGLVLADAFHQPKH